jgi:hypothetical protein
LDLDRPDSSFGCIVGEGHRKVSREPQDHVFESSEAVDEGAGVVRESGVLVLVVVVSSRECAVVVAADLGERGLVERLGAAFAGLDGGVVGLGQGAGHRGRPELTVGVGIGDRP